MAPSSKAHGKQSPFVARQNDCGDVKKGCSSNRSQATSLTLVIATDSSESAGYFILISQSAHINKN